MRTRCLAGRPYLSPAAPTTTIAPTICSEKIGVEQRLKWMAERFYVTTENEPLFDVADVCRMGKDLFVQHGFTHQSQGKDWIQRDVPCGPPRPRP